MALLLRSALWLLRVLFLGSAILFVGFFGFSLYAFVLGISDMLRFHAPDNLGLGIAFALFAIGAVPSFLVAFFTGRALWKDRKVRSHAKAV
jgi:hypothetical protein